MDYGLVTHKCKRVGTEILYLRIIFMWQTNR